MSKARQDLYESLSSFTHALESPDIISKDPISEVKHNERARLLRNGLAVSGFVMVEKFVKERTGEILSKIGGGLTPFTELPDGIRTAATVGVAEAMLFQAKYVEKTKIITHYQHYAKLISSTLVNPFKIADIAFCNNYINLSAEIIESILIAFRIDNPWNIIGGVTNRLGLGILAPKQAFENAAKRRHAAAHEINTATEYSDLAGYKNEATAFCLVYDLLISKALKMMLIRDIDYLKNKKIAGNQIELRIIKKISDTQWKEIKENVKRAIKIGNTYEAIKIDCILRGQREGFAVVKTTELGYPLEWYTPSID